MAMYALQSATMEGFLAKQPSKFSSACHLHKGNQITGPEHPSPYLDASLNTTYPTFAIWRTRTEAVMR